MSGEIEVRAALPADYDNLYVVPHKACDELRLFQHRRDEQAFIYGQGGIEYALRESEIITAYAEGKISEGERNVRLGALRSEWIKLERNVLNKVQMSITDQKSAGDRALQGLGLNPHKQDEDLRIDLTSGIVHKLSGGQWKPLERTPHVPHMHSHGDGHHVH